MTPEERTILLRMEGRYEAALNRAQYYLDRAAGFIAAGNDADGQAMIDGALEIISLVETTRSQVAAEMADIHAQRLRRPKPVLSA